MQYLYRHPYPDNDGIFTFSTKSIQKSYLSVKFSGFWVCDTQWVYGLCDIYGTLYVSGSIPSVITSICGSQQNLCTAKWN